ncbi:DTW domain-containing protein [Noviherbaspirillum sedimenti]|uniref:tRNA-uridine aminocarboxypropyltransferase n=1 Tax=Noviherbaspirillum sedimenti TaxID=2320865 RepID=A0A3A3G754_9BURK|nr:DTW domain-containing protein [Noviherbaspirillum sedimenti]
MTPPSHARRLACLTCLRPQQACICRWITPVAHAVEVVILQHPLEVANAKGSARLLHLSLPRSRLAVGEVFAEQALQALLYAPFSLTQESGTAAAPDAMQAVLLYPEIAGVAPSPPLAPALLAVPEKLRLVVLDGTWRKSRKMLYLNPLLQQLPRLPLLQAPPSRYAIRKAHRPHQLSTLEATCHALMQLENCDPKFQPLLQAFDGFVAQQLDYRPPA